MNYFEISALINAFSTIWLCFFILLNPQKSKTNSTFCLFLTFVAIWAGFQYLWISAPNYQSSLLYSKISNVSALFISTLFLHFTSHLINEYQQTKKALKFFYILNLILLPFCIFSDLLISGLSQPKTIQFYPLAGKLFPILMFEYFILPGYALYRIFRKFQSSKMNMPQLKIVFWGIFIAYIGSFSNFPACYKIPIYPYGNILIPAIAIFITYGILKHQLMDIRIIIQKNLIYTIMIVLITLLYFFSIFIIENSFREILGYKSFFVSIVFALIISLIFIPLKNIIQTFVEKKLFHGSYLEITQQNSLLRQEVAQTERLKSLAILASGIAHEIKNPLTPLKTFSEYLPNRLNDQDFLKKFSPIIAQEVSRIDKLVHELLEFAKPSPIKLQRNNIHSVINNSLELLNNDFLKKKIQVNKTYNAPQDLCFLFDHNQIKQALLNILLNAIDAMPQGGIITISTNFLDNNNIFQLRIQDTGIGIERQDIPHVFDPFFTRKDQGTGLGLSVTYEIIKNHNGRIYVESKRGTGTIFNLELPTH